MQHTGEVIDGTDCVVGVFPCLGDRAVVVKDVAVLHEPARHRRNDIGFGDESNITQTAHAATCPDLEFRLGSQHTRVAQGTGPCSASRPVSPTVLCGELRCRPEPM
jgi:hypothetical protein